MKGYYSEDYVIRMMYGDKINLEWDLCGAESAYKRFVKGEISIYQARAMIYLALRGGINCKVAGIDRLLNYGSSYFYTKKSKNVYVFDYEKIMKQCSVWLKKGRGEDTIYNFGSMKATMEWVNIIRRELKFELKILDVALGVK
jgi:hypothetical protein